MRFSLLFAPVLLSVCLVARADLIDDFTITGGGQNIKFSLPASTTGPAGQFAGSSFGFSPTMGTVNGVSSSIGFGIIFPGPCASCGTISLNTGSQTVYLFLPTPPLYTISYTAMTTGTLSFNAGLYTTGTEFPPGGGAYTIAIVPEATTATPEPSSFFLLGTGLVTVAGAMRRRLR